MRVKQSTVEYLMIGIFALIVFSFLFGSNTGLPGPTLVVIDNPDPNSMFPTYFQGDLFVLLNESPEDISVGDVVVYIDDKGRRVIHRVVDVVIEDGEYFFRFKGDNPIANYPLDTYDSTTLFSYDNVVGKVVMRIPYLGHFSLAIQHNPLVRTVIFLISIAAGISIVFWPEKKEEENDVDEYFEITTESLQAFKNSISQRARQSFLFIFRSKYKIVSITFVLLLVGLIVAALIAPVFLPNDYNDAEIGVTGVDISEPELIQEPEFTNANVVFYNITVHVHDTTTAFTKIEGYTLTILEDTDDTKDPISTTKWTTRRLMKGQFIIGGTVLIPSAYYNTLADGATIQLTINIVLHIGKLLGTTDLDPYQKQFQFTKPNEITTDL